MKEMKINNERYYVIFKIYDFYIQFYAYEKNDLTMQNHYDFDNLNPIDFYNQTKDKQIIPQVNFSVKWDGCANMNPIADGVMMHFCNSVDIENLNKVISFCYNHAQEIFDF